MQLLMKVFPMLLFKINKKLQELSISAYKNYQ